MCLNRWHFIFYKLQYFLLFIILTFNSIADHTELHIKSGTSLLYVDHAVRQLGKCLASIIALKSCHVEHLNTLFSMTILHCSD